MPLMNGSFTFERRVKTGDFEHKHASAIIHYLAENGEAVDDLLAQASTLARKQVHRILGLDDGSAPAPVVPTVPAGPAINPELPAHPEPEPASVVEVAPVSVDPPVTNLKQARRVAKSKADVVDAAPAQVVDDFTADEPAVTDADLQAAASKKNGVLKDGAKIRALLSDFVQSGQGLSKIPMARRPEFLQRLEALA
jgi:hypothetical protein